MNSPADIHDSRKRTAIIIVVVSVVVLLLIALIGSIALVHSVQSMQNREYDSMPVGRMFGQAFGIDSKDLKDVPENMRIYQRGCNYSLKGMVADSNRHKESAISFYQDAINQFEQYPGLNNSYAYDCITRLAVDCEDLNQIKEAEKWHKQAIDCAIGMTNKKNKIVAYAYQELGEFYDRHNRCPDAIKAFQSALDIDLAGSGPTSTRTGYDYWWMGSAYNENEEALKAIDCYKKALDAGKNKWKYSELAEISLAATDSAYSLSNYDLAQQYTDRAIQELGAHDNKSDYYNARLWKAQLLLDQGKKVEAEDCLKKSIPTKEKMESNRSELDYLWGRFADAYMNPKLANYSAAEQLLRDQLAIFDKRDDFANKWQLQELAHCLAKEKKTDEAGQYYARALQACRKAKKPAKYIAKQAIPVFQAAHMTQQLKAAQADLQNAKPPTTAKAIEEDSDGSSSDDTASASSNE